MVWSVTGCGETGLGSSDTRVLSAKETKHLLRQLPYRYTFRKVPTPNGAEGAVAGRAIGAHHTVLNFGISLGRGDKNPVPVPRAGIGDIYGYPGGGFTFTSDIIVEKPDGRLVRGPQFHTAAQWDEVTTMSVAMTDKICRAATSEPCPP